MEFINLDAFKVRLGVSVIKVIKNPNTGKRFLSTQVGNFKVQQSFDPSKPYMFMYENEALFSEGCLTNVVEVDNTEFVL